MNIHLKKLMGKSSFQSIIGVVLRCHNFLNLKNNIKIGNNVFACRKALLKSVKIKIVGVNNIIVIDNFAKLKNCSILIHGNNNRIEIGKKCSFHYADLHIEDDNNEISIGENSTIQGATHLAAIESTKILIGNDCMFSSNIHFRTGDSHSIINMSGERINPSQNINIGNHVWVGTNVTCLKGVKIGDNSIIGASSTVSRKFEESNCIVGGVPAKIIKTDINWLRKRI